MASALLILPTGTYRAEEYLHAASSLGVEVVIASERAQAMGDVMGARFIEVPLADPKAAADALVEHLKTLSLDAVIAVDDEGLLAAALAAERLGLVHNHPDAVRLTRDKAAMRRAWATAGVPQPRFEVQQCTASAAAEAGRRIGFPAVVKPCSLSASRGVIRTDSPAEAEEAAEWISRILEEAGEPAAGPVLVEEFVAGREVAIEGILSGGRLEVITVFDKPDPLDGPYFEETFYLAPARLEAVAEGRLLRATAAAVAAIGLTEGPIHAEARLAAGDDPRMLEVAARTIGGRCSKALELEGGGSIEELVVARACGLDGPPPRLASPAGVLMIPIPRAGVLRDVGEIDAARAIPHVTGVEITVPRGRRVRPLPEGDRYLGFVFARAADRDDVEEALREALATLEVDVGGADATVSE